MTVLVDTTQSSKETRGHPVDFAPDLPTGVTISGTPMATHTGPGTETPTVGISGTVATVVLATPGIGTHLVHLIATLSNSETADAYLTVRVRM